MDLNRFPRGVTTFVKIQKITEIISWSLAIIYYLFVIGFFFSENVWRYFRGRGGLYAYIFAGGMIVLACFFVIGVVVVLIRIFLRIKYKLRFCTAINILLLIKLPVFFITTFALLALILNMNTI